MTVTLAAAIVQSLHAPPAVRLTITSTVLSPQTFVAVRVHADGTEHKVMNETGARIISGVGVVTDYCAPFNQQLTYRVTAEGLSGTVTPPRLVSSWTWIVHPAVPALSVRAKAVRAVSDRARASRAAEFQPMDADPLTGDNYPVFQSGGHRAGLEGSIVLRVAERDIPTVDRLVKDDSVLLINTPGESGWDVRWLWVKADITYGNPIGRMGVHDRAVTLAFKQAADPDVDQTPIWTDAISEAYWATQGVLTDAALEAKYASALDWEIDNRV